MIIGIVIGVLLGLVSGYLFFRRRRGKRISAIVDWYLEVNPEEQFYIPPNITKLREQVGESTFQEILLKVDEARYMALYTALEYGIIEEDDE